MTRLDRNPGALVRLILDVSLMFHPSPPSLRLYPTSPDSAVVVSQECGNATFLLNFMGKNTQLFLSGEEEPLMD